MTGNRIGAVFMCLYAGYTILTYIRKSVSFVSPAVIKTEHLTKSQFGLILSSQTLGYSIGKVMGGVLVDMYSPSRVFTATLVLCAFTVILFTFFDSVALFSLFWFINGLSQGPGWPACAVLIKRWFPPDRFGTWWSVLSTSMNVSGTTGPIISAFLLAHYSWRFTLSVAGAGAIVVAGASFLFLSDKPCRAATPPAEPAEKTKARADGEHWTEVVWHLINQPFFICICANYMLVSLVRGACNDWGHLFLIQDKHHSHLTGSSFTSSQELGGIVGSLAAGYASDFLMSKKTMHNPRLMVIFVHTVVMSASIFLFMTCVSSSSSTLVIMVMGFCIGFGIYGSIALFGVVTMESTVDKLAGTAHSVVSLAANVGLVLSGYPMSLMARHYNWYTTFLLVQLVAMVTTAVAFYSIHTASVCKTQKDKSR